MNPLLAALEQASVAFFFELAQTFASHPHLGKSAQKLIDAHNAANQPVVDAAAQAMADAKAKAIADAQADADAAQKRLEALKG